jgi:hypothetical protein
MSLVARATNNLCPPACQQSEDRAFFLLLASGGTPASVIKSPRPNIDDSIENLHSLSVDSATHAQQSTLKRNCLRRDGGRCVITKFYNKSWDRPAEGFR